MRNTVTEVGKNGENQNITEDGAILSNQKIVWVFTYIYVWGCGCQCVWVRAYDRERERERERVLSSSDYLLKLGIMKYSETDLGIY